MRFALSFDGYTQERRQLNAIRSELGSQIDETIRRCNTGEVCSQEWLNQLENIASLESWASHFCHHPEPSNEGWLRTIGRFGMDTVGTLLTGSHIWMMGGLAYNGTTKLTGSETAGYVSAFASSFLSLGLVVESIGAAPRNLYDGVIGWWQGERPLFPQYDQMRRRLLVFAIYNAVFAIGSALDGVNQTTHEGLERDIQRPMASAGLSLMSLWALVGIINSGLKQSARQSKDPQLSHTAEAIDKLEQARDAIMRMSAERFAQFLLDLPSRKRSELLRVTGDNAQSRLDSIDLRRIANIPQVMEIEDEL